MEKGEVTVVDLCTCPQMRMLLMELLSLGGACSLAQQLFLSSPFLTRKDLCTGAKSKTCCYQAGRAPLLPAQQLMSMVEMM